MKRLKKHLLSEKAVCRIFRRAHAHSLTEITSDSFYYCNAAASHYNGINTVALLETEEYWIIRFKLAFYKKKKKEVTLVLQCIAKGKDLQKTSGLSAIYEMAVASKNFLQVKKWKVIEFNDASSAVFTTVMILPVMKQYTLHV